MLKFRGISLLSHGTEKLVIISVLLQLKCVLNLHHSCTKESADWALNMLLFYALVLLLWFYSFNIRVPSPLK